LDAVTHNLYLPTAGFGPAAGQPRLQPLNGSFAMLVVAAPCGGQKAR